MQTKTFKETVTTDLAAELNRLNAENSELIKFIEMTEAFTTDKQTAARIQAFMRENNYWPKHK